MSLGDKVMLYKESKRLGRSTAIGLLIIVIVILLQGLFGAWKMKQLSNELSQKLIKVSHVQIQVLTLKSMLINLRKLEKDILLHNHSQQALQKMEKRNRKTLRGRTREA